MRRRLIGFVLLYIPVRGCERGFEMVAQGKGGVFLVLFLTGVFFCFFS
jgi:hypothetical protein